MLRGNVDIAILQPIFQHDARLTLADLYGGFMDRKVFEQLMNDVVYDKNLEGSTPQDPKKEVRTMVINDYENTINPQMKFKWYMAENPHDYLPKKDLQLCHPAYWKEQDNSLGSTSNGYYKVDPVDELDEIQALQNFRFDWPDWLRHRLA